MEIQRVLIDHFPASKHSRPSPKAFVCQQALLCPAFHIWMDVIGGRSAYAAETVRTSDLQSVQHGLNSVPHAQVGVSDDGRGGSSRAVLSTGTSCGEPLHELDLANRTKFFWPIGAVH